MGSLAAVVGISRNRRASGLEVLQARRFCRVPVDGAGPVATGNAEGVAGGDPTTPGMQQPYRPSLKQRSPIKQSAEPEWTESPDAACVLSAPPAAGRIAQQSNQNGFHRIRVSRPPQRTVGRCTSNDLAQARHLKTEHGGNRTASNRPTAQGNFTE